MSNPATSSGPFVFISYASVNRSRVIEIVDTLESSGVVTWFDRSDIPGGTSYGPEIVSGIKNAAAVVLMCSEASLASRNVRQEIQLAWRYERPILPLLLEPLLFSDDVSYWLEGAQWIEVLDQTPDIWLEPVRYSLALMGYGSVREAPGDEQSHQAALVELPPNNLPDVTGPLIGRERELRQVRSLLDHARVLTLTGTGGAGKTRLAEQAARESAVRFADGIWFVDAASTTTADGLNEALAAVLGVQESPGEPLIDSVKSRIANRLVLLIFDNLEQNAGAGALVDQLAHEHGPAILATSRAPIRANGEVVIPVAPLETPDPQPETPASVVARNPAVQLFVNRARQAKPDFQLSDGNAYEVAAICAKLDGLPLAIELAAARSRILHPAALLARLDNRLSVLTRGPGRSARQQTLQSTIAWSYDLLGPVEQSVFRRAGVFAGGTSLEMLEKVASSGGDEVASSSVLDAVEELIDQNLLVIDRTPGDDEGTRVRMLETIREFALSMLASLGEAAPTNAAHAVGFLELADRLEPQLESGQQALALAQLSRDHANILAAIAFLTRSSDPSHRDLAVRMTGALWRFWWMRGTFTEGARLLGAALDASGNGGSLWRARALNGAGIMAFSMGDLERSRTLHQQAAELAKQLGSPDEEARSLDSLGIVDLVSGNIAGAISSFEAAHRMYEAANDRRGVAVALDHLCAAYDFSGDQDRAFELGERSLAEWTRIGDQQAIGQVLQQLGIAALHAGRYELAQDRLQQALSIAEAQGDAATLAHACLNLTSATEQLGDLEAAAALIERALTLYRQVEDVSRIAHATYVQGHVARNAGKTAEAQSLVEQALQELNAIGQRDAVALCLESLAGLCVDRGDAEQAAMLLGAATQIREETGAVVPGHRVAELEVDRAKVLKQLGDNRFTELLEAGRTTDPLSFARTPMTT